LRTRAIPERLTGVFTTRRYTNTRLPYLTLLGNQAVFSLWWLKYIQLHTVSYMTDLSQMSCFLFGQESLAVLLRNAAPSDCCYRAPYEFAFKLHESVVRSADRNMLLTYHCYCIVTALFAVIFIGNKLSENRLNY